MSLLMIFSIVHWHTRHNHINKQCICDLQCHKYHMLPIQRGKTGNIITFAQFEEGDLLSESSNDT